MLRQAIIQKVGASVPDLESRIYDPLSVPAEAVKPYATVLLPPPPAEATEELRQDVQRVEIRLFNDKGEYAALDTVEQDLVAALDRVEITDSGDGEKYVVYRSPGGGDFIDESRQLIGRLAVFEAPIPFVPA